jgi:Flp pilus assembly protein TadG
MIILKNNSYTRSNKGFIAAFFTVFLPVFIGIMALSVDLPRMYSYNADIKSALDLAVIAGISQLNSTSDITTAKNTAVTYLNANLSMTLPNFTNLTTSSTGLTLQAGTYDSSTCTFTYNEAGPTVNALKITYSYTPNSILSGFFMIDTFTITASSLGGKTYAGYAPAGTTFPIILDPAALTTAAANSNVVRLYQNGGSQNSYLGDYVGNSMSNDVDAQIDYFQNSSGTPPPAVAIGSTFMQLNASGQIAMVYSGNLSGWVPTSGTTLVFPVGTLGAGNNVTITGYVLGSLVTFGIGSMSNYADITIVPGSTSNSWSGLVTGAQPTGLDETQLSLLASGSGLVL